MLLVSSELSISTQQSLKIIVYVHHVSRKLYSCVTLTCTTVNGLTFSEVLRKEQYLCWMRNTTIKSLWKALCRHKNQKHNIFNSLRENIYCSCDKMHEGLSRLSAPTAACCVERLNVHQDTYLFLPSDWLIGSSLWRQSNNEKMSLNNQ